MSYRVVLLVFTLISANGSLIRAENASVVDYPYHVSLQYNGEHICSAALLNEQWLITAASCAYNHDLSDFNVRIETSIASSEGKVLDISKIVIHDDFDRYSYDDDVALIYLKEPIEYSVSLQPVLILSDDYVIDDGTIAVVTGWTKKAQGGSESELKATSVPIVNQNTCNSTMPTYKPLSENMVCAGYMTSGVETCQGDLGAPLVYDEILIGILSYGLGCSTMTHPGIYTRVSKYTTWITTQTGILM